MTTLKETVFGYADLGWRLLPVQDSQYGDGKRPLICDWVKQASNKKEVIDSWFSIFPNSNFGVLTGQKSGIVVIDIDPKNGGMQSLENLQKKYGKLPNTVCCLTGGQGYHYYFDTGNISIRTSAGRLGPGIDIRGEGGQAVIPPSTHKSGNQYQWDKNRSPFELHPSPLPKWILDFSDGPGNNIDRTLATSFIGRGRRNNTLFKTGCTLHNAGIDENTLNQFLRLLNQRNCEEALQEREIDSILQSILRYQSNRKYTDDELVNLYCQEYPNTCYGLGEFRRYHAGIWQVVPDKKISQEILGELQKAKNAGIKPNAYKLNSVKEVLKVSTFIDDRAWDSHQNELVFNNGVLNLTTLELREHHPQDYATRTLPYDYNHESIAPTWKRFLQSVFSPEVQQFLQEFSGYCLTEDTSHELAIWLYGPPASGKSTFIAGLRAMLGDKAGVLGLANIEESRFGLDGIQDKTLLVCEEQASSKITKSHIINRLVSGEPILVDRKFQKAIEIKPKAKIVWAMNTIPAIKDSNNGIFRRVRIVQFPPRSFTPSPEFKKKIVLEGPGILNWSLEGYERLQARGYFVIPDEIGEMQDFFKQQASSMEYFIAQREGSSLGVKIQFQQLYEDYVAYCVENKCRPEGKKTFSIFINSRNWKKKMSDGKTFYSFQGEFIQ